MDPSLFDTRVYVTADSTLSDVSLAIEVTSTANYLVPWSTTIDLADYVCAESIPDWGVTAQNTTLVRDPENPTAYTVSGTSGGYRKYASKDYSLPSASELTNGQQYVFLK